MTAVSEPAAYERGRGVEAWVQRGVIGAGLVLLATSLLAAFLGGLGWWRPWLVLPLLVVAAGWIGAVVARLPAVRLGVGPAFALLGVAVASGWWLSATHSSQILPRRDAGSNLQAAIALADTGHRILAVPSASIGGPGVLDIDGITLASPAFFETGSAAAPSIQPQFVIGPAAAYSLGRWLGGVGTTLIQPAWLSAAGILAVGLLAAVVIGRWWGPVAAVAVALQFPIVHTGRATYSEPLALLTLGAGLLAWVVAARFEHRRAAVVAGLLVGGTCLVRIDGLREAILLIPVAVLGLVQGRAWPRPLLAGTAVGTGVSLLAAVALSNQYLGGIAASLVPLLALGVVFVLAACVLVLLSRRGFGMPRALARILAPLLAGGVVVVGLLLAARPLMMTVRQDPNDPGSRVVAGLQARQGLRVDGGRTYAEQTVTWLAWWVGPLALAVALVALAVLVHRLARAWTAGAALPAWAGPLVVGAGSTVLTLYRPGITPDHPWAERRLVIALPFVALLVVAAAAWLWRPGLAAATGSRTTLARAVAGLVVLVLVAPTAAATWPHRAERVEAGTMSAVASVCRALRPGDVALAVDSRAANEWPQVIRGMCKRPALSTTSALRLDPIQRRAAADRIAAGLPPGGRLVLLAADSPDAITVMGAIPDLVADIDVREDDRLLERRPDGLVNLPIRVWLGSAVPARSGRTASAPPTASPKAMALSRTVASGSRMRTPGVRRTNSARRHCRILIPFARA